MEWGEEGVKVASSSGLVTQADHAIVTVPIGVLQEKHSQLFSPRLPRDKVTSHYCMPGLTACYKVTAIERMGAGSISKLYLEWNTPWWTDAEDATVHLGGFIGSYFTL